MKPLPEPNPTFHLVFQPEKISALRILIGLFGAPIAWVLQIVFSEPIVAHACYPFEVPVSEPIWEGLSLIIAAISIFCLEVACLSGFISWMTWQQIGHRLANNEKHALELQHGRIQFVAKLSLMSSFLFTVAIIFNSCAALLVPPCSSWF